MSVGANQQNLILHIFLRDATTRDAGKKIVVKDLGLEMTETIRKLGFNDQILTVYSSLMGEKALDTDSFTRRLIR